MAKGANGQDPQAQGDAEDDEDLEESESEDTQEDDEEEDDSEEADAKKKPSGSDLDKLTPEQKDAEILRLRDENSRRRIANRTLREQQRAAEEARKGKKTPEELEKENVQLRSQNASLIVSGELRDYVAEKHPKYLKLTKRIAKDVDLEDVDPSDLDSVRDAVASAVEDFVKEVPMAGDKDDDEDEERRPIADAAGRPVGSPGAAPSRRAAGDTGSLARRKRMFPNVYSGPKA